MLRRIDSFTTDEAGRPVSLPDLDPSSTFVICRDEDAPAVGAMESRDAVDRWIEGCLFGDLRTLILGIDQFHQNPETPRLLGGCNFLLAASCFMALEYLAQVYGRGRDATSAARHYVADFLSRVDPRYPQAFDILWSCFRNGIVHGSWPQAVCIRGDESTRIAVGANPRIDGDHFGPDQNYPAPSFIISSVRLFLDLERSYDQFFRSWLLRESDDAVLVRAAPRLLEINPRDTTRVRQLGVIREWSDAVRRGGSV
jgi:hypothetical protein